MIEFVLTPVRKDLPVLFAGAAQRMEILFVEDFACVDKSCAPPPVGTGGSRPSGASPARTPSGSVQMSSDELDLLFTGRRDPKKTVDPATGTFTVEGVGHGGQYSDFGKTVEGKLAKQWNDLGPSSDEYIENFALAGKIAMGIDLKTGEIDSKQAAKALNDSKWYTEAHNDCQSINASSGIPLDNVVAATVALSAGRLWSGTKNGNRETAARLADIVANPFDIEITPSVLQFLEWKGKKAAKNVGKIGTLDHGLKPGKINTNDIDSVTLVEVLYAMNTMRGYETFDNWAYDSRGKSGKIGSAQSSITKSTASPYPFFTSKGTQQVQQAVAILRQEVSPRQAISGPKYSSFYNNIRHPEVDYSSTNDTWHYRIMALNSTLTYTKKGATYTGKMDTLTVKGRSNGGKTTTAQDLFQKGVASKPNGLASGDGMFRDVTRFTRQALDRLKREHPAQFGNMKIHEFQALIWVHYGGGAKSNRDRLDRWDGARALAREVQQ